MIHAARRRMPFRRLVPVLSLALAPSLCGAAEEKARPNDAQLAREFNDPLTVVPQLAVQNAYSPAVFGTDAHLNRLIVRPLFPRIRRYRLFPLVQLVRPSFSLVTVPTGKGGETRTEFGDIQLFDLAILPWPDRASGFIMGFGPVFVFPTATHDSAGQGAWQIGPAFGAIYKGVPGLLVGGLVQNPISFAYTRSSARSVSTLLVQPVALLHLWRGLYVKTADATWSFGWHDGAPRTVPLGLGFGYVIPRKDSPPLNFFVTGEWMAYRENAPVAAQTTIRLGFTVAFPELLRPG